MDFYKRRNKIPPIKFEILFNINIKDTKIYIKCVINTYY